MMDDNNPAELSDPGMPQAAGLRELKGQSESSLGGGAHVNLDMIMDVNVSVSVEVGRARMSINDLLKLSQGAIIELDRMAGEPLDVLVNGTLVARGEIVVVRDKFGIMLTEVVSPEERLRRLR
ncbi:flagellar motor switch protein FliN [Perlucidibaca piscinae]|uniref:flagellar motor switch protein FliN n=1 Tax=Perlucidibaca piscinae TaxID=392589 RepID=UPI0009FCAB76|nr:flagellar motor switch protein FliN [Perlucidibaca piscinae]